MKKVIEEINKNLNARKGNRRDKISNCVLKECVENLSKAMQIIFFTLLKLAKSKPIGRKYKKDSPTVYERHQAMSAELQTSLTY